ncbi:unnamed protein product [Caenorhabditis auriculariae]|uniref:Uncharacterized protein n=1 Tax=Caenorhabditis auriculariae TaxID=2777116 RepID=A0A8S1HDR2_9PELO|nr:unnamed protein product [Caenorhabditis auriculariae]
MIDETTGLSTSFSRSPRSKPKRPPLLKRQTVDEDAMSRTSWGMGDNRPTKDREWSSLSNLKTEMKSKFDSIGERLVVVDQINSRLQNLERMLMNISMQQHGATTPSTVPLGSLNALNESNGMARLGIDSVPVSRSVSWSEQQNNWQRPVPPLTDLGNMDWQQRPQTSSPPPVPSIHIDDEVTQSSSRPPDRTRI